MTTAVPTPTPPSLGRDEKIRTLRCLCGRSLDELSWEFGLSRERIRQICKGKKMDRLVISDQFQFLADKEGK